MPPFHFGSLVLSLFFFEFYRTGVPLQLEKRASGLCFHCVAFISSGIAGTGVSIANWWFQLISVFATDADGFAVGGVLASVGECLWDCVGSGTRGWTMSRPDVKRQA